jgi:cytochrome c553
MTMRAFWACLFAVACVQPAAGQPGPPPQPPTPSPLPPSTRFEHDMMVRFHMHENLGLLRAIEKLLVRGRLDDARHLARAIAEAPDEPGLGAWASHAALVRERAARLAAANGLDEACGREAQLADACGSCHVAADVVPEFRSPGHTPPDQPTIEARMARHLWATDRLWEGIVGGADDSWRDGLDVLAAAPLRAAGITASRLPFARRLQILADRARQRQRTDNHADRATSYGEILVTCTGCHVAAESPATESR